MSHAAGTAERHWFGTHEDDVQSATRILTYLSGNGGDDRLTGGFARDTLWGGAGDDTLDGSEHDDLVGGGPGRDVVHGSAGDDVLTGGAGHDTLDGGNGEDRLNGEGGNDLLSGGASADIFLFDRFEADPTSGRATPGRGPARPLGNDTISDFEPGVDRIHVDLAGVDDFRALDVDDALVTLPDASGTVLVLDRNGERVVLSESDFVFGPVNDDFVAPAPRPVIAGTSDDDRLRGTDGPDRIRAGDGADRVEGRAGNDVIEGGDDDDTLEGGAGDDLLRGEDDDDHLAGGVGDDTLEGGDDDDHLEGGHGHDRLDGGRDDDTLEGGDGDDALEGGDGDDALDGDRGDDTVRGGDGDDILVGDRRSQFDSQRDDGTSDDRLDGGEGDDYAHGGWRGDDTLFGRGGEDTLAGGSGNDHVDGGAGDDTLWGDAEPGETRPYLLTEDRWPEGTTTLRYAFIPIETEVGGITYGPLDAETQPLIRQAMTAWEEVANVQFVETEQFTDAHFLVGSLSDPASPLTLGLFEWTAIGGEITSGVLSLTDIVLGEDREDRYDTALHEIGHAMGIDHSDMAGVVMSGGEGGFPSEYNGPGGTDPGEFDQLRPDDIAAAVALYGPPQEATPEPAPQPPGQTPQPPPTAPPPDTVASINDGDDTLHGRDGDDRLTGGGGDDLMRGGDGRDTLEGGPGDDTLHGNAGDDLFIFRGAHDDDTLHRFEPGDDRIEGLDFAALLLLTDAAGDDPNTIVLTRTDNVLETPGGSITFEGIRDELVLESTDFV